MIFSFVPLVFLMVVVALIWSAVQRHRNRPTVQPSATTLSATTRSATTRSATTPAPSASGEPVRLGARPSSRVSPQLSDSLARWRAAGLISADQASDITSFERDAALQAVPSPALAEQPAPAARRVPIVAEALGYLGGILGVVGLSLLVTKYWPDMATFARLGLAFGAAIVLTAAGAMVPRRNEAALERLRGFLWLGATAAGALGAGVVAVDVFDASFAPTIALACAATVMVHSALLWQQRERPVQQVTCLAGLVVTVGTAVAQVTEGGLLGVAVWCTGVLLVIAGLRELTTFTPITLGIGGAAALIGAGIMTSDWRSAGILMLLLTASALLALAAAEHTLHSTIERVVLTVIGVMGMFQSLPIAIQNWGEHSGILTGALIWSAGAGLLFIAGRPVVHTPTMVRIAGGAALVGGAAVMGMQSQSVATLVGLATAIGLLVLGTYPEYVLMSLFGSVGLLINVPWAIRYFFPGEGRAPLLILVSGVLIVAVAVWLSRMGGEIKHQFHFHHH